MKTNKEIIAEIIRLTKKNEGLLCSLRDDGSAERQERITKEIHHDEIVIETLTWLIE